VNEKRSEQPKIKVVDRRKFSSDGDPLDTAGRAAETTPPATPRQEPVSESTEATPPAPPPEEPISESTKAPESGPAIPSPEHRGQPSQLFLELVTMLAGQAELLLVGTEDMPAQPAEAQRMIDYLGVLEEKTAGNLSDDEAKLLSGLLYQLRTFFLQRK